MACPTYTTNALIVKKIKLNEADLIIEAVGENGALLRFVAKSARKPGNTFSNRLELFNIAYITCAKCKGLDIVREVREVVQQKRIRSDYARFLCASSLSELAQKLCLEEKENSVTFDFLARSFECLEICSNVKVLDILLASLIKFLAIEGVRPELNKCVMCRNIVSKDSPKCHFSFKHGGVVCVNCFDADNFEFDRSAISTLTNLLELTYDEILATDFGLGNEDYAEMIDLIDKWIIYHVSYSIKSLKLILQLV